MTGTVSKSQTIEDLKDQLQEQFPASATPPSPDGGSDPADFKPAGPNKHTDHWCQADPAYPWSNLPTPPPPDTGSEPGPSNETDN